MRIYHNILHGCRLAVVVLLSGLMGMVVAGCSSHDDDPTVVAEENEDPAFKDRLYLTLKVFAADNSLPLSTRAQDYYFEDPQTQYERIKDLRVIICDSNNIVKHNRSVVYNLQTGAIISDNLTFKLNPGHHYIHLLANEQSLPEDVKTLLRGIIPGDSYPAATLEAVELAREGSGASLFGPEQYIPMAESFEVELDKPLNDLDRYVYKTLFVTRVATKFTFAVASNPKILKFQIDRIATKQYLFPHALKYSPDKYDDVDNQERLITEYGVPADAQPVTFECTLDTFTYRPVGINGDMKEYWVADPVYLCETELPKSVNGGNFRIRLLLGGSGTPEDPNVWTVWKDFPNLPDLPRNTHVVVRIDNGSQADFEVDLVPYIGCTLNPYFGLEDKDDPEE